jgi:hypothetical protein
MWIPRKLNTDFGCPFPNSIVKGKLPNQQIGVFYMAEDRTVRVLTGIGSDQIQLFDNIYTDKLSLGLESTLKADDTDESDVYFTFYDYKLYVSLKNKLLIWDSQAGGEWTKYSLPIAQKYIGVVDRDLNISASKDLYSLGYEDYNVNNLIKNGTFSSTADWTIYTQDGSRLYAGANSMIMKNVKDGYASFYQYVGWSYGSALVSYNYYQYSFSYDVATGSIGYYIKDSLRTYASGTLSENGTIEGEFKYYPNQPFNRLEVAFFSNGFITLNISGRSAYL